MKRCNYRKGENRLIQIEGLCKQFPGTHAWALDGIHLQVEDCLLYTSQPFVKGCDVFRVACAAREVVRVRRAAGGLSLIHILERSVKVGVVDGLFPDPAAVFRHDRRDDIDQLSHTGDLYPVGVL